MNNPHSHRFLQRPRSFEYPIIEQEAIPWCTKHNHKAMKNRDGEWTCWHWRAKNCESSLGGPDHKWWKDA